MQFMRVRRGAAAFGVGLAGAGLIAAVVYGSAGEPARPRAVAVAVPVPAPVSGELAPPTTPAAPVTPPRADRSQARVLPVNWIPPAMTAKGISRTVERAYRRAANAFKRYDPACHLRTALLEAIGKVESEHANNGYVNRRGNAIVPIIGPALDGSRGVQLIHASEIGRSWHGDAVYEHAVGPMQFLPETFVEWATDGDHDGTADPENVYDSAATAARYLCGRGADLADPIARKAAILRYNSSEGYYQLVEAWFQAYLAGSRTIPDSKIAPPTPAAQQGAKPPASPAAAQTKPAGPGAQAPPKQQPAAPAPQRPPSGGTLDAIGGLAKPGGARPRDPGPPTR